MYYGLWVPLSKKSEAHLNEKAYIFSYIELH